MASPMSYTDFAQEVLRKLDTMDAKLDKIMSDDFWEQDEGDALDTKHHVVQLQSVTPTEEQIKKFGQRVPYNLIWDKKEIEDFRAFIYYARANSSRLTDFEQKYVDFADKTFDDVRISSKHLRILQGVYQKLYNKQWPFKSRQGYMYKYQDQPLVWEWFS
jgi:hypothetical protein